jgi:phage shock protein C
MQKKLFRSKHSRVLLGVCGGIGEYFNVDPVIVRIIAVLLLIISGFFPAVIAYLIMAVVIPIEGSQNSTPRDNIRENVEDLRNTGIGIGEEIRTAFQKPEAKPGEPVTPTQSTRVPPPPAVSQANNNRALWLLGLIIIIMGIFFLVINLFGWRWFNFWPISLILVGLIIILLVVKRR